MSIHTSQLTVYESEPPMFLNWEQNCLIPQKAELLFPGYKGISLTGC